MILDLEVTGAGVGARGHWVAATATPAAGAPEIKSSREQTPQMQVQAQFGELHELRGPFGPSMGVRAHISGQLCS